MSVSAIGASDAVSASNSVNESFEASFVRQQEIAAANRESAQSSPLQDALAAANRPDANVNQGLNTNPISLLATQYDIGAQITQAQRADQVSSVR